LVGAFFFFGFREIGREIVQFHGRFFTDQKRFCTDQKRFAPKPPFAPNSPPFAPKSNKPYDFIHFAIILRQTPHPLYQNPKNLMIYTLSFFVPSFCAKLPPFAPKSNKPYDSIHFLLWCMRPRVSGVRGGFVRNS
jgi:hypothetical protein